MAEVEIMEFDGGFAVVPESEMKKIVIPSPPTVKMVPVNPRPCILYVADVAPEACKAYAEENKVVLVVSTAESADAFLWAKQNASTINIKKDDFSIKADAANLEKASKILDAIYDADDDVELDDPEVFAL
jgi:hypothetical protein